MARVHILGNSNAYGFGLEDRSWPSLIKADTNRRRYNGDQPRISVVQIASPGNLLYHILESGLLEASVNCNRRGQQIGLFCVGACEASILRSRGETEPRRSQVEFKRDLDRLAMVTEQLNVTQPPESALRLIMMSTVRFDEAKSFCSQEGDDFDAQRSLEYSAIVQDYATSAGVRYIDAQAGFDQEIMLTDDGIHLSEKGEAFVYAKVMPAILEELGIGASRAG